MKKATMTYGLIRTVFTQRKMPQSAYLCLVRLIKTIYFNLTGYQFIYLVFTRLFLFNCYMCDVICINLHFVK